MSAHYTETPFDASHPSVAADGAGNFVVTWQDDADQDGYEEIRLRWLMDGAPTGGELIVSGDPADHFGQSVALTADGTTFEAKTVGVPEAYVPTLGGVPRSVQVAATEDGSFVLVWVEADVPNATRVVRGVLLDSDLRPESPEFQVNQSSADLFRLGRAYFDAGGLLTVEWEALGAPSGDGLYSRSFTPMGAAVTSEAAVALYPTDGSVDSGTEENPYSLWEIPW